MSMLLMGCGTSGIGIYVYDTFIDTAGTAVTSHTGQVGATWTQVTGLTTTSVISDANRARSSGTSAQFSGFYASGVPTNANYGVSALVRRVSDSGVACVLGRVATGAATYYRASMGAASAGTGGNTVELYRFLAGSFTKIGGFTSTFVNGSDYTLTLSVIGSRIVVSVDGVDVISVVDTVITAAGRPGIGLYTQANGTNSIGYQIDTVTAWDIGTATSLLVADGNSQTAGVPTATNSYVSQMQTFPSGYWSVSNLGVGGQTTQAMNSDATSQVAPLLTSSNTRNVVVFDEVINSIYFGATGAEAYGYLQTYAGIVRGVNGSKLIVITPQPDRFDFPGTSTLPGANAAAQRAEFQSRVTAFMSLFNGDHSFVDEVYDANADSRFADATNTTYFQADKVHFTNAAQLIRAAGVEAALARLYP